MAKACAPCSCLKRANYKGNPRTFSHKNLTRVKFLLDNILLLYYFRGMKIKTSITLSDNVLNEVDKIITSKGNRSTFIETAIQYYLKHRKKEIRNQNDLDIINKLSDSLNEEAEDILSYQVKI